MGAAKLRGTREQRIAQAIREGRSRPMRPERKYVPLNWIKAIDELRRPVDRSKISPRKVQEVKPTTIPKISERRSKGGILARMLGAIFGRGRR